MFTLKIGDSNYVISKLEKIRPGHLSPASPSSTAAAAGGHYAVTVARIPPTLLGVRISTRCVYPPEVATCQLSRRY